MCRYRSYLPLLSCLTVIGVSNAHAGELAINNEIVTAPATVHDAAVVGIEVTNITGGPLNNVDLRLVPGDAIVMGNGVVQIGSVESGASRVAFADLVAANTDGTLPESILWRVDYDDATGAHHQLVLGAALAVSE